jgi:hypothetical protein
MSNEFRDEAIANMFTRIAELAKCAATAAGDDMIYAWPYGLGVRMQGDYPAAVGLIVATVAEDLPSANFENGKNEKAVLIKRKIAINRHIREISRTIEDVLGE